jgi:hypothetical protein
MHIVATKLKSLLPASYYLAGGTALALQIGHRESVDLDYFTSEEIDTQHLFERIQLDFPGSNCQISYQEKNTLWITINTIKVSFIQRKQKMLMDFVHEDVFQMASLSDIVCMKLAAICGREEYKDYFDLAYLSESTDVRSWTTWWMKVSPESDTVSFLVALNSVVDISEVKLSAIGNTIKTKQEVVTILKKIVIEITKYLRLL